MKSCPRCNIEYFDKTLEFCLEDGTPLVSNFSSDREIPTVIHSSATTEKTVNLHTFEPEQSQIKGDLKSSGINASSSISVSENSSLSLKLLEISPLVLSLAHNWWQWLYLNNQYYSTFTGYIFSFNFLMWFVLLLFCLGVSLYAVNKFRHKAFAYAGLIILSINLILFIVPKR